MYKGLFCNLGKMKHHLFSVPPCLTFTLHLPVPIPFLHHGRIYLHSYLCGPLIQNGNDFSEECDFYCENLIFCWVLHFFFHWILNVDLLTLKTYLDLVLRRLTSSIDLDLERDLRVAGERDRRPADLDLDLDLDLERFLLLDADLLRLRERERPLPSSINLILRPFSSVPSSLSIAAFKSDLQLNSTTPSFFLVL